MNDDQKPPKNTTPDPSNEDPKVIRFPGQETAPQAPAGDTEPADSIDQSPDRPAPEPGKDPALASESTGKAGSTGGDESDTAEPPPRPRVQAAEEIAAALEGAVRALIQAQLDLQKSDEPEAAPEPLLAADDGATDGHDTSNVIPISSGRRAQEPAPDLAQKLTQNLKQTLGQALSSLAQRQDRDDGELTIDAPFLMQHGRALLGDLFQGLANTLSRPANLMPGRQAPPETESPTSPPRPEIHVNFDLGSLLSAFSRFKPPSEPPDAPPPDKD